MDVFYVPRVCTVDIELFQGRNTFLNDTNIDSFYLFSKTNSDISIIIGYEPNNLALGSLLLCRFHNLLTQTPFVNINNKSGTQFFSKLKAALGSTKVERRRFGGSSGLFTHSSLRRLMEINNSCPRKGPGGLYIRMRNGLSVNLYYICCGTKIEPKTVRYSNPVDGGQFHISNALLTEHPFLYYFLMSKILASKILISLSDLIKTPHCSRFAQMKVNPKAVSYELFCWQRTIYHTEKHFKENKQKLGLQALIHDCKNCFHMFLSSTFLNFTLVMHAVLGHLDVFADKLPSLENRIVFGIDSKDGSYGRGGIPGKFVFCILDWNAKRQARIAVWTDPANEHVPHARHNYGRDQGFNMDVWARFWWGAHDNNLLDGLNLPDNYTLADIRSQRNRPENNEAS